MLAGVLALGAADPAVMKEIEQFRAKHEEDYRRQFVTLAGLSPIKEGVNTVGSASSNGDPARTFEGFKWFPIDEQYRVSGRFIKDPSPRLVKIPNQLGDEETYTTEGIVEFTLDGQKVTLRPMSTRPGRLYFIFRDGTSGKEPTRPRGSCTPT
jgi:uncharacterized protein (DUF1684 family)